VTPEGCGSSADARLRDSAAMTREARLIWTGTSIAIRAQSMAFRVSWHARIREGAISFLAIAALCSILLAIDFRVREQATRVVTAASPSNVARSGAEFSANASKTLTNVRDQAMQHLPMAVFMTTAGVLLLFMLKT